MKRRLEWSNAGVALLWLAQICLFSLVGPSNVAVGLDASVAVGVRFSAVAMLFLAISCLVGTVFPARWIGYALAICGLAWAGGAVGYGGAQASSGVGVNVAWVTQFLIGVLSMYLGVKHIVRGASERPG